MQRTHPSVAYASGFAAVVPWSTAVIVAAKMDSLGIPYSIVAFLPVVLGWFALIPFVTLCHRRFVAALSGLISAKKLSLALLAGLALAAYEVLFWYSLVSGPRLEVNAINYLWPIFQSIFTLAFFRSSDNRLFRSDLLLLLVSYLGALLIIARPSQLSVASSFTSNYAFFFAALGGAFSVGLHFAIGRYARSFSSGDPIFVTLAWNFLVWPISIICMAVFFWYMHLPLIQLDSLEATHWIAWEGAVVFGLGYLLYIFSIQQYPSIGLSGIAYLTPVLGSIWLVVFFSEKVTASIVFGLVLIVISNITLHSRFRHLNPAIVSTAAWGIALTYCLLVPGLGKSNLRESLGSLGAVIGILIGFTLSRLASADREQTTKYLELFRLCRNLLEKVGDRSEKIAVESTVLALPHRCTKYFFRACASIDWPFQSVFVRNCTHLVVM